MMPSLSKTSRNCAISWQKQAQEADDENIMDQSGSGNIMKLSHETWFGAANHGDII